MVKQRKSKVPTDPVGRSIWRRESGIRRMEANIRKIREDADARIALIQQDIKDKQVLLDALKRGKL